MDSKLNSELMQERLHVLIENMQAGVLVENEDRKIVYVNQAFCDIFMPGTNPDSLIGMDCTDAAEQSKDFFINPEKFLSRVNELLHDKKLVLNDTLQLVNGSTLERDYIPVYVDSNYLGHMWKYTNLTDFKILEAKAAKLEKLITNLKIIGASIIVGSILAKIIYNIVTSIINS